MDLLVSSGLKNPLLLLIPAEPHKQYTKKFLKYRIFGCIVFFYHSKHLMPLPDTQMIPLRICTRYFFVADSVFV